MKKFLALFKKKVAEHEVKPEDWIVDPDWQKWAESKVVIPYEIHRFRSCKFIQVVDAAGLRVNHPLVWRMSYEYDSEDNMVIQYCQSNYPEDPRVGFTIQF